MDRDFAVLTEYIENGHDVIVPSPNMQDLYGQYEHNYWEQVNDERKQVIFHNIGTGLARIPFEYIKYIQSKFDALKAVGDSNGKDDNGGDGGDADNVANGMEEKKDAADDGGVANQEVVDMDIEEEYVVVQKEEESEEQVKVQENNKNKTEAVEMSNDQSKAAEANTDDANGTVQE